MAINDYQPVDEWHTGCRNCPERAGIPPEARLLTDGGMRSLGLGR